MSTKFFYLYLIGGSVALLLMVYTIASSLPNVNYKAAWIYLIPVVLLYYMAFKVYHEKQDKELM